MLKGVPRECDDQQPGRGIMVSWFKVCISYKDQEFHGVLLSVLKKKKKKSFVVRESASV